MDKEEKVRRLRNGLVQFRYFIPQLIGQFLEFPHSFLVIISTILAMVWSAYSILHDLPLSENFWGSLLIVIIGYTAAIVLHLLTEDDSYMRMFQTFKIYPQALRFSLVWGMLFLVAFVVAIFVFSLGFATAWFFFGYDFFNVLWATVSILLWPALGLGLLFWGLIAIDEADHAAENYGNGVSMENW